MEDSIREIHQCANELAHQKEALNQFLAAFEDKLSSMPSYRGYMQAKEEVSRLELQMREEAEEDGTVVAAEENIEVMRRDIEQIEERLSLLLIKQFQETGENFIPSELGASSSHEIVIKAKLGRKLILENQHDGTNMV